MVTRVDLQNGGVVSVSAEVISAVEEEDGEAIEDLPHWQKDEVETARAIVADSGERFVNPPDNIDFHEYRHMERFVATVENAEAAEQLLRAIKGKGAFRFFKDTASRLGLLKEWYQYRDAAMKEFAMAWAEARKVPVEDDLKPNQHP